MNNLKYLSILSLLFLGFSCQKAKQEADLIINDAVIWVGDGCLESSIAIHQDTVLAIGSTAQNMQYKGSKTKVIDAQGRFIVPGFIDSHVHFMSGGQSLLSVNLRGVSSQIEFTEAVGEFAKTLDKGVWIQGGNWDHTLWGGELPTKSWIDEVTPNTPVFLFRLDWHMALANSAALKFAGVDKKYKGYRRRRNRKR